MKPEAFIFDLDGTLLDSMPFWRSENRRVLEYFGYEIDEAFASELPVLTCGDISRRLDREGFLGKQIVSDKYLENMTDHYLNDVSPKPGAGEFLRLLHDNGVRIFLASATPVRITRAALAHFEFLDYFEDLFDDTTFGISKADATFFRRLCAKTGVLPEACVLFEDSAYSMHSAREAGILSWGISDEVAARVPGRPEAVKAASAVYVDSFFEAAKVYVNAL